MTVVHSIICWLVDGVMRCVMLPVVCGFSSFLTMAKHCQFSSACFCPMINCLWCLSLVCCASVSSWFRCCLCFSWASCLLVIVSFVLVIGRRILICHLVAEYLTYPQFAGWFAVTHLEFLLIFYFTCILAIMAWSYNLANLSMVNTWHFSIQWWLME